MEILASLIDHTLLKADSTASDITRLCAEAREEEFKTVCIHPCWVALARAELAGSGVGVCTVIGFPLGAGKSETKLYEAQRALADGAAELDMVQNIGALLSGQFQAVEREIEQLARAAHEGGAALKVILETCLLNDEELRLSCRVARQANADFVKTSTGFSTHGATVPHVELLHAEAGPDMRVKASGGIRTLAAVRAMVKAGATRIGSSSGLQILRELRNEDGSAEWPNASRTSGQSY